MGAALTHVTRQRKHTDQQAASAMAEGRFHDARCGWSILALIDTSPLGSAVRNRSKITLEEAIMGRGILLWLLGVPIPIIIILALIWH